MIPNRRIYVSNTDELNKAISIAEPGDQIILNDGIYDGDIKPVRNKNGLPGAPVVIKAANRGKAEIAGNTGFCFTDCSFITIEGLKITASGCATENGRRSRVVWFIDCNNIRVTRNYFKVNEICEITTFVYFEGKDSHHNHVDRNFFDGKKTYGLMLDFRGSEGQVSQYNLIECNYFKDNTPRVYNGKESMRIGHSSLWRTDSFSVVQYNLFENCSGEPEIISIKASEVDIRYNTFRNSQGQVVLRHGNRNRVYGNYFFGSGSRPLEGGVRVYGDDHKVFNNYMYGLTDSAIQLDRGDALYEGEATAHWTPLRTEVCFNTIVECKRSIDIGRTYEDDDRKWFQPRDCVIANNIVVGSSGILIREYVEPVNFTYKNNILFPQGNALACSNEKILASSLVADPKLEGDGEVRVISSESSAIGSASKGFYYASFDIDGNQRKGSRDIGSQEYSPYRNMRKPLEPSDVGPDAP